MYLIMFEMKHLGAEEIDSAETKEDAEYLLQEYRIAYPADSKLWIQDESTGRELS